MTTIRHTTTLFEYDCPQLFVARDDDGGQYLALLVDREEEQNRYLVVQVNPESLSQFRAGALELRPLIAEASKDQWYLATTTNLDEPLAIELQRTPIEERFLPDEGFTLADSPPEEGVLDAERDSGPPANSVEVRECLIEALKLDLVGPWGGHALAEECLPGWVRPSNWYLTGFLIPSDTPIDQRDDDDDDDDFGGEVSEEAGLPEESSEERKAAKKGYFPSSMGLSFLASKEAEKLHVTVRWGDYAAASIEGSDGKSVSVWQRTPCTVEVEVTLDGDDAMSEHDVPDSGGLRLHVVKRQVNTDQIPPGTQAVSIFLVNRRTPSEDKDSRYAFQAEIEVQSEHPFVPRPDPRGAQADEWDDKVADLHYADVPEYATGHGVSAEWDILDNHCEVVRTAWIPSAEVEKTETAEISDVELSMEALGALDEGDAAQAALSPLVVQYRRWIDQQQQNIAGLEGERRETAEQLIQSATAAAKRIQRGIDALAADEDALDAFRVANRAVARALQKRSDIDEPRPKWRPFQLAFIMINLPGLVDPQGSDRKIVDLLFFPTGGGKTEAYLGLAAFAMVLRRLRHRGGGAKAGAGVSVLMRYTLRLLTLDQLSRAAGLVCALELEREEAPDRYGEWPFEIGLWVGKAATPNFLGRKGDGRSDSARSKVMQFKADPKNKPSPIPLENCPWCGTRFEPDSFSLEPDTDKPRNLRIVCMNFECDFAGGRPLPIVAVDEPLYRRLPAFLIATVDKFASLPWVGPSGVLLGGADRYDNEGFYGAAEPGRGTPLEAPLSPPDLIVQDELHLISGPLGTMVGLYESAIEALCVRSFNGRAIRPKIVASTATVRRAQDQIHALFGRSLTQVFPPPGPDRRDSFFAGIVPADAKPARRYLASHRRGGIPKF